MTPRRVSAGTRLRAAQYAGDLMLDELYAPLAGRVEAAVRRRQRDGLPFTETDRRAVVAEVELMLDDMTPATVAAIWAAMTLAAEAAE